MTVNSSTQALSAWRIATLVCFVAVVSPLLSLADGDQLATPGPQETWTRLSGLVRHFVVRGVYDDDPVTLPGRFIEGDMLLISKTPSLGGAFEGHEDGIAIKTATGFFFIDQKAIPVGTLVFNVAVEFDSKDRAQYVFTGATAASDEFRAATLNSRWIRTDDNLEPYTFTVTYNGEVINPRLFRNGSHLVISPFATSTWTTHLDGGLRPLTLFVVNASPFAQDFVADGGTINGSPTFTIAAMTMATFIRLNAAQWFSQ